eukprot:GHUV01016943.1.p1 GENE.GHUV01016943.1~~GHUV01016943.1.p1  ORF type:complete len:219 (+),score=47.63 GHUV01016943.1:213-869(+)
MSTFNLARASTSGRPFCGGRVARPRTVGPCPAHSRRTVVTAPLIGLAAASIPCAAASAMDVSVETDKAGRQRVRYEKSGWKFWEWRGHKVHYITAGTKGPPVLLIHGYGASAYHWRYQIPALARNYQVFALDLLGFGWSEKALVEYSSGGLWGQQIRDFIQEIVYAGANRGSSGNAAANGSSGSSGGVSEEEKVVLVGNSLGGYACMNAAANAPNLIK